MVKKELSNENKTILKTKNDLKKKYLTKYMSLYKNYGIKIGKEEELKKINNKKQNSLFVSHSSFTSYGSFTTFSSYGSFTSFGSFSSGAQGSFLISNEENRYSINYMEFEILKYEIYLEFIKEKESGYEEFLGEKGYNNFLNFIGDGQLDYYENSRPSNYSSQTIGEGFFSLGYGLDLV